MVCLAASAVLSNYLHVEGLTTPTEGVDQECGAQIQSYTANCSGGFALPAVDSTKC